MKKSSALGLMVAESGALGATLSAGGILVSEMPVIFLMVMVLNFVAFRIGAAHGR